jgi:fructose-1,6-bisphosphatase I
MAGADQSVTLDVWLQNAVANGAISSGLASVLATLAAASAELAEVLRTAGLAGHSGYHGATNIHGDSQKKLDIIADEIFDRWLTDNPRVGAYASEERPAIVDLGRADASFVVCFDPLDGSSNVDVNLTVGSIFAVRPADALMRPGREQLAAGFASYGPSTSLILACGGSAALFQFDPAATAFVLLDGALSIPRTTTEYAINSARASLWDRAVADYIEERTNPRPETDVARFNMRWTGSMVADVQRILQRGGVFLYPADAETRDRGGRLRLLYEAAPMAMIVEAAGGRASTGTEDLLDLTPTDIHQKVPVILGSADEVEALVVAHRGTND